MFRPDGRVTAGNACPLNDGAAAVIVMSEERANALNLQPLARIVASGVTALDPEIMGLGPIEACRQAMGRAKLTIDDIDLVEINEAFAAQVVPSAKELNIPWEKLNVHGGGIALGHPFGMTGARIMTTLLNGLEDGNASLRHGEHVRRWWPGHGDDRRTPHIGSDADARAHVLGHGRRRSRARSYSGNGRRHSPPFIAPASPALARRGGPPGRIAAGSGAESLFPGAGAVVLRRVSIR